MRIIVWSTLLTSVIIVLQSFILFINYYHSDAAYTTWYVRRDWQSICTSNMPDRRSPINVWVKWKRAEKRFRASNQTLISFVDSTVALRHPKSITLPYFKRIYSHSSHIWTTINNQPNTSHYLLLMNSDIFLPHIPEPTVKEQRKTVDMENQYAVTIVLLPPTAYIVSYKC